MEVLREVWRSQILEDLDSEEKYLKVNLMWDRECGCLRIGVMCSVVHTGSRVLDQFQFTDRLVG